MNYSPQELIVKISPQQRLDMIGKGMSPINPEHILAYLNGKNIKVNQMERVKTMIGEQNLFRSAGHSKESAFSEAQAGQEYTPSNAFNTNTPIGDNPADIKKQMMMEMDGYANSTGSVSPSLLSLNPQQKNTNKMNLNEVVSVGKTLATNYYNAFIKSIQNPSTAAHMQVYKALKEMLEREKSLQNTAGLPHYQKSVNEVAKQMHNQITNRLND